MSLLGLSWKTTWNLGIFQHLCLSSYSFSFAAQNGCSCFQSLRIIHLCSLFPISKFPVSKLSRDECDWVCPVIQTGIVCGPTMNLLTTRKPVSWSGPLGSCRIELCSGGSPAGMQTLISLEMCAVGPVVTHFSNAKCMPDWYC